MRSILFIFIIFLTLNSSAQDRVLLTISDHSITIDDFMATYHKNRLDTDSLPLEKSLQEYLDLYIKFKLKVVEAESLGLDTLPSFIRELDGYRRQLAKPYLTDKNISEELLLEAYARLKYEVAASHILIQINGNDTVTAYNKIIDIKKQLDSGESDFVTLANKYSEDPSVKDNNGNLGYFSALAMVYQFENAAYNTDIGNISDPVRTRFGYHLVKVNDKRSSRGEVKVAHIMINIDNKNEENKLSSKRKIFEIYDSLVTGSNFSNLANMYSDDKKSAKNGGELDWFGTNKMIKIFEEFSFDLESIGDFSKPFETEFGWHIVKLLDKKTLPAFTEIETSLRKKVERDSRSQKTRNVVINRLKNEWGFKNYPYSLNAFDKIDKNNFTEIIDNLIKVGEQGKIMFEFKNNFHSKYRFVYQKDFAIFLKSFSSRINSSEDFNLVINQLYETFIEQRIIEIEDANLESKYNEFRLLVGEYHDGILLFNLMDDMVWSKAINDTSGLKIFYDSNKNNYMWPRRLSVDIYSSKNEKIYNKVLRKIKKGVSSSDLISCVNKKSDLNLSIDSFLASEGDNIMIDSLLYSLETIPEDYIVPLDAEYKIIYVKEVMEPYYKDLSDIKGLVISDYQSLLEDLWLNELKEKHTITFNNDIFLLAQKNRLDELPLPDVDVRIYPKSYKGNFESAFYNAVKDLGSSKEIYFEWYGNLFTTELKSTE